MRTTSKFYFTYGSGHWPGGGWTEVEAEDMEQACDIFSIFHPRHDGFVACGGIYDEDTFMMTRMAKEGNLGKSCVETISVTRTIAPEVRARAMEERCGPDA